MMLKKTQRCFLLISVTIANADLAPNNLNLRITLDLVTDFEHFRAVNDNCGPLEKKFNLSIDTEIITNNGRITHAEQRILT